MGSAEANRALGVLVDRLAEAAFQAYDLDGASIQELLLKAGLLRKTEATQKDVEESEYDVEVGDPWYVLTAFAQRCRKMARGDGNG